MLKLLDVICFEKDIPELNIVSGSSCTIVHVYTHLDAFEFEFVDEKTGATTRFMRLTQTHIDKYLQDGTITILEFSKDIDPYENFKEYKKEYVSINYMEMKHAFCSFLKPYLSGDEIIDQWVDFEYNFEILSQYEVFQGYIDTVRDYMPLKPALVNWIDLTDQFRFLEHFVPW